METLLPGKVYVFEPEFKSYYVVWKLAPAISIFLQFFSLNRTMQYGNPIFAIKNSGRTILFKSYYVVWKLWVVHAVSHLSPGLNRTMQYGNPLIYGILDAPPERFKSYYVVWKLIYSIFSNCLFTVFKSYYVVWKPIVVSVVLRVQAARLNRTMQYGNIVS